MGDISMWTLKKYVKLNEERKVILDNIREDGFIYEKWRNYNKRN